MPHSLGGDAITSVGAIGAILSPWWLTALHAVSEIAAIVAPILGVIWLLVQIVVKIQQHRKQNRFRRELSEALRNE